MSISHFPTYNNREVEICWENNTRKSGVFFFFKSWSPDSRLSVLICDPNLTRPVTNDYVKTENKLLIINKLSHYIMPRKYSLKPLVNLIMCKNI